MEAALSSWGPALVFVHPSLTSRSLEKRSTILRGRTDDEGNDQGRPLHQQRVNDGGNSNAEPSPLALLVRPTNARRHRALPTSYDAPQRPFQGGRAVGSIPDERPGLVPAR